MKASLDNPEVADELIRRLTSGEGILNICEDPHMPAESTVYYRMAKDEAFRRLIADAREAQQDYQADDCIRIADAATPDDHQVARLRIWARQWHAAKLAPKKYGDRVVSQIVGPNDGPVQTQEVPALDFIEGQLARIASRAADDPQKPE